MKDSGAEIGLFSPAQTNTALYCQLHERGHSQANLLRAQQTYRACCKLFNGRYRKTERAFICHAVGTGSAVAEFDDRIELVLVGMLHAAYDSGHYPDGRYGPTKAHRKWLGSQVGDDVERLVADYNRFEFETGQPETLLQTGIPKEQEHLLLIALSHDVDDMADAGLVLAPKYGRDMTSRVAACAALARQIGQERLAVTLEEHGRRNRDAAWVADLESGKLEGFRIAPNLRTYAKLRRERLRGKSVEIF